MTTTSAEVWDDDADFDLSSSGNIALDLPRSEAGSLDAGDESGGSADVPDKENNSSFIISARKDHLEEHNDGDIEYWDADIDDDQGDTIKLSDLTSETLAHLASFRKQTTPTLISSDLASLSLDNLSGKVTNLGSFAHAKSLLQDGKNEWDDDLEMPETFPSVLSLRQPASGITTEIDLDMEEPSFDSTSDATTSGQSTSEVRRRRSPTQSSFASRDEQGPRSSSSASRYSHLELGERVRTDKGRLDDVAGATESTEIESSFELPESVLQLKLTSQINRLPTTLSQQDSSSDASLACKKSSTVVHTNEINGPRYLNTTAASRARQAGRRDSLGPSNCSKNSSSRILKVPKRLRNYGNGRELDSFADLPVKPEHDTAQARLKELKFASQSPYMSPAVERANRGRHRRGQRVEPTLIRNLSGPQVAPRTIGNMTWNPKMQRWEGNEEEGRRFESAVKRGEERPYMARLSSGSANMNPNWRLKGQLRGRSSPVASAAHSFAGAKVVGDMVFDPINLCWLNKNKEDEVDPFSAMEEKEGDLDTIKGSKRMSNRPGKARASSSSQPASSSSSSFLFGRAENHRPSPWSAASINRVLKSSKADIVPESLSSRIPAQLWLDSIAAKTRHDEQVAHLLPADSRESSGRKRGNRPSTIQASTPEHLYLIQELARRVSNS